jgi:hypothetical protein
MSAARTTLVGIVAWTGVLVSLASSQQAVAGTPTMGALPQCTAYESALAESSARVGHVLRLACTLTHDV